MSNLLVVIIVVIILTALAGSVIAGMSLFTIIFNDSEFTIDETKPNEVQSISKPTNAKFWGNITSISQGIYTGNSAWCKNGYTAISGGVKILLGNLQVIDSVPTGAFYVDGKDEPIPIGWGVGMKNIGTTEGAYMVYVNCLEIK